MRPASQVYDLIPAQAPMGWGGLILHNLTSIYQSLPLLMAQGPWESSCTRRLKSLLHELSNKNTYFPLNIKNLYRSVNTRTEHRQPLCCAFCPVMHEDRDWYAGMHSDPALLNKRLDEWVKLCMKTIQGKVSMCYAQYAFKHLLPCSYTFSIL